MKAVLMDFNGTLYNDTRFHVEAWGNYFRKYHGMNFTEDEIFKMCIGPGNMDIFRNLFGDTLTDEQKHEMSERKENEYRAAARKSLALKDGAVEFLDYLSAAHIPYVLATASTKNNIEFYLREIGLEKWFDYTNVVYDDGTLKGKPDPAFYIEAARRVALEPKDCMVCEDSMTGIESAVRAGAGRIVVLSGNVPKEKLLGMKEIYAVTDDFVGMEKYI